MVIAMLAGCGMLCAASEVPVYIECDQRPLTSTEASVHVKWSDHLT